MFLTSHNHTRAIAYISILETLTREPICFFPISLETGPADEAGITGYLLQVRLRITLVLFISPSIPGELEIADLLAHAQCADATGVILLTPDGEHYWCSPLHEGGEDPAGTICRQMAKESTEKTWFYPFQKSWDVQKSIGGYLLGLRKEINGWLYRKEGESGISRRELTIQTLLNQIILKRIFQAHLLQPDNNLASTLQDTLYQFAGTVPVHDRYDLVIPDLDDEAKRMVETLASVEPSSSQPVHLSWIEPSRWPGIFARYLALIPKGPSKKNEFPGSEEVGHSFNPRESLVSEEVIRIMADKYRTQDPGPFCDPSAGCGEVVMLVFQLFRESIQAHQRPDTIISRLILAGNTIHAVEHSPVRTAIIRLALVMGILGGQYRDSALSGPPLWYPLRELQDQIRSGSLLFDGDIADEFLSSHTDFATLRYLHPVHPSDILPQGRTVGFCISAPQEHIPGSIPQIGSFLTRRYASYQSGVSRGALLAERCTSLIRPEGFSIIFLKSCWLSEAGFQNFRRWISKALPFTVVLQDRKEGSPDLQEISAIISRRDTEKNLKIIRFSRESEEQHQGREYTLNQRDLPDEDGWRLDDPWERHLRDRLYQGTIPLDEYVFGELYPGNQGAYHTHQHDEWISIHSREERVIITHGERPDSDATVIIPGADLYLMGILSSPWIHVLLKSFPSKKPGEEDFSRFKSIPIPPVDPYSEEESSLRLSVEQIMERLFMLTRREASVRTWHDKNRIERQKAVAYTELCEITGRLFRMSPAEREEFQRREKGRSSGLSTPCFQIF